MTDDRSASTTQRILHWARVTPHAVAVIERDHAYSYADLAIAVAQCATALRATGMQPGMLVGLECSRRYLHLVLILACEIIGATSVSVTPAELAANDEILARCALLCVGTLPGIATRSTGLLHLTQATIDRIARLPLPPAGLDVLDAQPDDRRVMRLVRTSGSTGRPKTMAMTQAATRTLLRRTASCDGIPDHAWNFINVYNFALRSAYMESTLALRAGRTVVSSHAETLLADLQRFATCRLTLVSGEAARLPQALPADWPGRRDCVLNVKGGPLAPSIRAALLRDVVTHIVHSYATVETYRLAISDATGMGTICPDVSIRIVDDAGCRVAPGEVGLIEARSPGMADHYVWDAAATQAAFTDGWYRTNDLGHMPEPDRLVVLGRADDVVNLGGVKFAPQPLEARIKAIDGVDEAVLISVTNAAGLDELHVVMQLQPSASLHAINPRLGEIVSAHTRAYFARQVTDLPRTATGKVRRNEIRAWLRGV